MDTTVIKPSKNLGHQQILLEQILSKIEQEWILPTLKQHSCKAPKK